MSAVPKDIFILRGADCYSHDISRFSAAGPLTLTKTICYKLFDGNRWRGRGFGETGYMSKDGRRPDLRSMAEPLQVLHIEAVSCERLLSTELLIVVAIQWAPL